MHSRLRHLVRTDAAHTPCVAFGLYLPAVTFTSAALFPRWTFGRLAIPRTVTFFLRVILLPVRVTFTTPFTPLHAWITGVWDKRLTGVSPAAYYNAGRDIHWFGCLNHFNAPRRCSLPC